MSRRSSLDRFVLIDLEATCWEDKAYQEENSELLEIGLVEVNIPEREITKRRNFLIKPLRTNISEYCTNLTGITQEMVDQSGMTLAQAIKKIKKEFPTAEVPWGAWGNDEDFLREACEKQKLDFPFKSRYIDFQWMYSFILGEEKPVSLHKALIRENLEFIDGTQHRALPDALNSARVILSLLTRTEYFMGTKNE